MAETLGYLCDKLTIVKLKQYHTDDNKKLESLLRQEKQLQQEIDDFITGAILGNIPMDRLTFSANKVFKQEGNETRNISGSVGEVFAELAKVNCDLWHEQEKVYDFANVPEDQKNTIVKRLAILNLERNKCIDAIDKRFQSLIGGKK
jgi:hypothetical protein